MEKSEKKVKANKPTTHPSHIGKSTYRTVKNVPCSRLTNYSHIIQAQIKLTDIQLTQRVYKAN